MTARRLPQLLDAHRHALDGCRRCGNPDAAAVPILSEAKASRVMLVGQAPGKVELSDRRPFAGRAGRTLFRWLERAGVGEATVREQVYIGAITRCYPGPSPAGRGDRVPSPRERALCGEWLDAELRMIQPRLIIPVGRLAIDRFLGAETLDRVIGRVHAIEHVGGASIAVPLPHPSGASSWTNDPRHRELLDQALALLRGALCDVGVASDTLHRRSA